MPLPVCRVMVPPGATRVFPGSVAVVEPTLSLQPLMSTSAEPAFWTLSVVSTGLSWAPTILTGEAATAVPTAGAAWVASGDAAATAVAAGEAAAAAAVATGEAAVGAGEAAGEATAGEAGALAAGGSGADGGAQAEATVTNSAAEAVSANCLPAEQALAALCFSSSLAIVLRGRTERASRQQPTIFLR